MIIYDNGEVRVETNDYSARITVLGSKPLYLTLPELAGIAESVVAYLVSAAKNDQHNCLLAICAEEGPIGGYVDKREKRVEWTQNHGYEPF